MISPRIKSRLMIWRKKKKEKYEKIIKLGLDDYEQIVELSDEATKNIDEREKNN
ncbi:YkyA family protein [Peribacillus frigoritolerans]|nr:YkyA family protein [Peribacillus frigoritolerans]